MSNDPQGQPPTPEELEKLLGGPAAGEQVVMVASQQIIHRRFNFDVQSADGARILILTSVLPSGVPLDEHVYVFGNPENAESLGKKLAAPSVHLPGQNGAGPGV